uniref:chitin synthase n=1 Tax=Chromera velia CCMP2878 TaxID=1169474 RepID=A0A0G4I6F6_9ALVE|eukprot:Cvel_11400.t1-p1 / transcript=Cvel_11400.t1 / gene=Cvel_11400 / organism=Chromera_velia_CCMP2878 / gene_product=Chitin synthase 1, putative / transcript_product=Chitin synthase 1, putative / location=Cvel_scaffold715:56481-62808(+) / protein_length=1076 / sequence_SO=supercontig / SO=protein_coding / is_pseudo=false
MRAALPRQKTGDAVSVAAPNTERDENALQRHMMMEEGRTGTASLSASGQLQQRRSLTFQVEELEDLIPQSDSEERDKQHPTARGRPTPARGNRIVAVRENSQVGVGFRDYSAEEEEGRWGSQERNGGGTVGEGDGEGEREEEGEEVSPLPSTTVQGQRVKPQDLRVWLPSEAGAPGHPELFSFMRGRSMSIPKSHRGGFSPGAATRRQSIRTLIAPAESQRLQFKRFEGAEHTRPQEDTLYFLDEPIEYPPGHVPLGVLFPFYNEEAEELQASLQSLATEVETMGDLEELDATFQVCLVMDGWNAAAESMRKWLKEEIFPARLQENPSKPWWREIEECASPKATFTVCRVLSPSEKGALTTAARMNFFAAGQANGLAMHLLGSQYEGAVPTDVGNDKWLHLTLLVKKDNRRKHNSHEWFLSPFCQEYNVNFAVLCDTGVLFGRQSVLHLVRHLEKHESSVGVTGRQRIMTARQQFGRADRGMGWLWRSVQLAEYEMTVSCFMGFYSLIGALPVIPGPCGIYRIKDLEKSGTLKLYFDTVNAHTMQSGLVLSNAKLAEDRILAIAAALTSANEKRTRLVPEACFYNDAEVDSQRYLLQRRRWINGDLMLLVWMLFVKPSFVLQAQGGTFAWRWSVYLIFLLRFFQMLATVLSPAMFAILLYVAALQVVSLDILGLPSDLHFWLALGVSLLYVVLSLVSLVTALFVKWVPALFFGYLLFGMFAMCLFIGVAFSNGWNPVTSAAVDSVAWVAFLLPFFVLLTSSLESFCRVMLNIVQYILCLPLTINYFAVYAFARTSDLSWGNRPAAKREEEGEAAAEERKLKKQFHRIGVSIAMGVLFLNLGAFAGLLLNDVARYIIFLFAGFTAVLPVTGTLIFNLWRLFIHMKRCCCGKQALNRKIMRNRHERLELELQKSATELKRSHKELLEAVASMKEDLQEQISELQQSLETKGSNQNHRSPPPQMRHHQPRHSARWKEVGFPDRVPPGYGQWRRPLYGPQAGRRPSQDSQQYHPNYFYFADEGGRFGPAGGFYSGPLSGSDGFRSPTGTARGYAHTHRHAARAGPQGLSREKEKSGCLMG